MTNFEEIKPGSRIKGLASEGIAEIVSVSRFGQDAMNLVFRVGGKVGERLLYRGEESGFEFVDAGRLYAFDADGALLRLASEAYRIRLAHLFDPYLAVSALQIEALPHQITAVYGEMLPFDHFWWTFFHEASHITLHKGRAFADDKGGEGDWPEHEADAWAEELLVGRNRFSAFKLTRPRSELAVKAFATQVDLHPGIVVGMLQHSGVVPFRNLNGLNERFEWAD